MKYLWYDSDEVTEFHPIVQEAIKCAIEACGYSSVMELVHHPTIPNSTIVPDFAIKLKSSQRYIFVLEVKKTPRDVLSQRYQNQARSYVSDFAPYWEPNFHKYFCLTNIEDLILFADRKGTISTCILKNNPKSHTPFDAITKDISVTIDEFQKTIEHILNVVYHRERPQWDNNWLPIIDTFYQNYISVSRSLNYSEELSEELSLYEFFRLLAFSYIKDYYSQIGHSNQSYFRNLPTNEEVQSFKKQLDNNYSRVMQLDFKQVFSHHPNSSCRIFPENFQASILQYFKHIILTLNNYSSLAISENSQPEYIFNLLTSKIYDKNVLHKKGKVMSDSELSILLATLTINKPNSTVLDPCSGDGALLDAAYDYLNITNLSSKIEKSHNQLLTQISGIEIDPFLAQLATFRLISKNLVSVNNSTSAKITPANTFLNPAPSKFDVVLMNPPFLRNDNPNAPITELDKVIMNDAIKKVEQSNFVMSVSHPNLYFYFVNYSWHYLNNTGRAGYILMAKFLNNKEGEYLKEYMLDKLETIILYPRNYFEDFKVTTVITILSKQPTENIKFLRIINPELLSEPDEIKKIIKQTSSTTINADYTIKVTDRNLSPFDNWKSFFNDPSEVSLRLNSLNLFTDLSSFFQTIKRGASENCGGSKIIYPTITEEPYSRLNSLQLSYGVKNNRLARSLILEDKDLLVEKAIHFPRPYDEGSSNGFVCLDDSEVQLDSIFKAQSKILGEKWRKIVNSAYNSKVHFDILIPRADRTKHAVFYNPNSEAVVLTTNFFYLSNFQNSNCHCSLSDKQQIMFITAYLNSCFGQIQFEIHSNNQEGLRKIEGFQIEQIKIPDINRLTDLEIEAIVSEFNALNKLKVSVSGDEGINSPRRPLDEKIAAVIFKDNNLGFESSIKMTDFFQLYLADLVEDRRI